MSETQFPQVLKLAKQRYGSLSSPSCSFVLPTIAAQPYVGLRRKLSRLGQLEETTDPNDDVSFRFVLSDGQRSWALDVSMIGPFGVLRRLEQDGRSTFLTGEGDVERRTIEGKVVAATRRAGLTLLPQAFLEREVPLSMSNWDEDGQTLMYHALISQEILLPWRPLVGNDQQ